MRLICIATILATLLVTECMAQEPSVLPPEVKVVWDRNAFQESAGALRHRLCINGLWQWQPSQNLSDQVPTEKWGYFKVPGCWPSVSDYMQTDSQRIFAHPDWQSTKFGEIKSAWYQREINVPAQWAGLKIQLSTAYVNSLATVYLDGIKAGEIAFPGADLDITKFTKPGNKQVLSILVVAAPLKGVLLSYVDTAAARNVQGKVDRRGLCGDIFLLATPQAELIEKVRIETSVRKQKIAVVATLAGLNSSKRYRMKATVDASGEKHEMTSESFDVAGLKNSQFSFESSWHPKALWDIHTPDNKLETTISLLNEDGSELDRSFALRSGFREFWIDGRDFYLNGSRIYLSSVPFDNAQISAHAASYASASETFRRLKKMGINYVYAHNYDCLPGSHLSFEEILRAADDAGMLFGLTQPHFSHYDWKMQDAAQKNGYADHAEFYVNVAASHPSVVFYSMSHNATGYNEDMNPDLIGTNSAPRDNWSRNNANLALRAEALVRGLDQSRIIYHHASGDLGAIHNSNFYTNFTPVQELSDWFEHWSIHGVKPAFTCEYGAPFSWDWTMYRGWFNGKREFGSAKVPWEFCFAEWNSQFLGDQAFKLCEAEKKNLRWEADQFRKGGSWHRWDYPYEVGSNVFEDRNQVFANYLRDNWRAFRTLGLSGNSPWDYEQYWRLKEGTNDGRHELRVDWDHLQQPGYSADFVDPKFQRMDIAFDQDDWEPTVAGEALLQNNQPLLAYIAGGESQVTSNARNYQPDAQVEKQLVLINNSRTSIEFKYQWTTDLQPDPVYGQSQKVETGNQVRIPISLKIPKEASAGEHSINIVVETKNGHTLKDSFDFQVLAPPKPLKTDKSIAIFDPKGQTSLLLERLGVEASSVQPESDLSKFDTLIVGKQALGIDGPIPNISRVQDGLRVICFEQDAAVLEKRFGFRVVEYGLRQAFPRQSNHPVLSDLPASTIADWNGEATLLPSRLSYESNGNRFNGVGTVKWCGIDVTRAWRCGNRGNVASVLIEKPACGDFCPILDGGFSLQYSPLMEFREGQGMIMFCQMDVCGRSQSDPAADRLAQQVISYVIGWKSAVPRNVVYAGEQAGFDYLKDNGVKLSRINPGLKLTSDQVLVCGPGCAETLVSLKEQIRAFHEAEGHILLLGIGSDEANQFLPFKIGSRNAEHIDAFFPLQESSFRGIGPADVHNRDVRKFELLNNDEGLEVVGDGILASKGNVVFCQMVPWSFDYRDRYDVKRTFRRSAFTLGRILSNLGVAQSTPLLERFGSPVSQSSDEKRWLTGFYRDVPEEMDDPYRFFRW